MKYHRINNYWEPTYDGRTKRESLSKFNWEELDVNNGPNKRSCFWNELNGNRSIIAKVFTMCDFWGNLEGRTFTHCTFDRCYWNRGVWKDVKFQNCRFENSSFAFANFENCQFNGCSFKNIGISGNETKFTNCIIDPESLIKAAYTNTNEGVLKRHHKEVAFQINSLEQSKAKLARQLNLNNNFYSEFFYSGIRVAILQEIKARIAKRQYHIKWYLLIPLFFLLGDYIEYVLWKVLGALNGWGEKTIRVLVFGLLLVLLFAFIYRFSNISPTFGKAFIRSFDISIVAGYSKICNVSWLELLNLVLGMIWYSIAIPTVINKLTRTRY